LCCGLLLECRKSVFSGEDVALPKMTCGDCSFFNECLVQEE
jgi:hypothetical protein